MKTSAVLIALGLLSGSLYAATPKEDVQAAIKKIGDNYSWTTTTTNVAPPGAAAGGRGGGRGGFGGGPISGKAEGGYASVSVTGFQGNMTEGVLKGTNGAVKNQDGAWETFGELAAGGGGGRRGGGGLRTLKFPAVEAADLAGKAKELKAADGAISGDLPADAAGALMTLPARGGGAATVPTNPKGSVKFWVKDGALVKYELHVEGMIDFGNGENPINRTTTVEISAVGSTKAAVPEDVKKKL